MYTIMRYTALIACLLSATTLNAQRPADPSTSRLLVRQRAAAELRTVAVPPVVNVNSAGAEQLMLLPGVGQATVALIVAGRPYKVPADLMRVKGIKVARFGKMAPFVSVAGQTTAKGKISVGGGK